jgi:hypothetical protein
MERFMSTHAANPSVSRTAVKSGFIVSPLYDTINFIGAPMIALVLGAWVAFSVPLFLEPATAFGTRDAWTLVFISVWTYGHLCAVGFRSHLNQQIYRQFRFRFTVIPLLLCLSFYVSDWLLVSGAVLAVLWDVYHSAMQNFGFCRIYDSRLGNSPIQGRRLDMMINHLLYAGPIVGGLSLASTLMVFSNYSAVGWYDPEIFGKALVDNQHHLRTALIAVGSILLIYYLHEYRKLIQQGYRVSPQKVCLLFSAGVSSIWAWGFLPPVQAFFVSNFYHALQYFAIVWAQERKNMRSSFGLTKVQGGQWLTFTLYVACIVAAGVAYLHYGTSAFRAGAVFFTVVSLMHFWYDSFVWSVRKAEVG